jgi:hypothetical protein
MAYEVWYKDNNKRLRIGYYMCQYESESAYKNDIGGSGHEYTIIKKPDGKWYIYSDRTGDAMDSTWEYIEEDYRDKLVAGPYRYLREAKVAYPFIAAANNVGY